MNHSISKRILSVFLCFLLFAVSAIPVFAAAADRQTANLGYGTEVYNKVALTYNPESSTPSVAGANDLYRNSVKVATLQPKKDRVDVAVTAMQRTSDGLNISLLVLNGTSYKIRLERLNYFTIHETKSPSTLYVKVPSISLRSDKIDVRPNSKELVQLTIPDSYYNHNLRLSTANPMVSGQLTFH